MKYAPATLISWSLLITGLCLATNSVAHNKVVVIPLFEDSEEASFTPFAPITSNDPTDSDYDISALTVFDKTTKLTWQRIFDTTRLDWNTAWNYCRTLDINGQTNWRLPEFQELQSLISYGISQPAINGVAFPATPSSNFWTSTTSSYFPDAAIRVSFFTGIVLDTDKENENYVRCVR